MLDNIEMVRNMDKALISIMNLVLNMSDHGNKILKTERTEK